MACNRLRFENRRWGLMMQSTKLRFAEVKTLPVGGSQQAVGRNRGGIPKDSSAKVFSGLTDTLSLLALFEPIKRN
jgi:hypothetical protein